MRVVTYKCDRCGRTINETPKQKVEMAVASGVWQSADVDGNTKRMVDVDVTLTLAASDDDRPELCRVCIIDILSEVEIRLYLENQLQFNAKYGTFVVQVNENGWHDCVREDIERTDLSAKFDSREEAAQFIDNVRGLMHTGGGDTEFRIVPSDPDAREMAEAPDEVQD